MPKINKLTQSVIRKWLRDEGWVFSKATLRHYHVGLEMTGPSCWGGLERLGREGIISTHF